MAAKDDLETISSDSWMAWSRHVLHQLETDTKCLYEIKREITLLKIEIAKLKVKSGIWGAIGGAVPLAVGLAIWLIKIQN